MITISLQCQWGLNPEKFLQSKPNVTCYKQHLDKKMNNFAALKASVYIQ